MNGLALALLLVLAPAPPSAPSPALFERVSVIGASVSRGFGSGMPLAGMLEHLLAGRGARVRDRSARLAAFAVGSLGEAQVAQCIEDRASLVVGVDFLFWYACGVPARGKDELGLRIQRLRRGLEELARLDCALVIGDLPDMRHADPKLVPPQCFPSPAVLEALNQEIRKFAAPRRNVRVLPLARWVREIRKSEWRLPPRQPRGAPVVVRPSDVFQADGLHPTPLGALLLLHRTVGEIHAGFGPAAAGLRLDLARELRRLHDS